MKERKNKVIELPTKEHTSVILEPYLDMFQSLINQLDEIDSVINQYAGILEVIQPIAPGKLGIRFIKHRTGEIKIPTFISWIWTPVGKKAGKIVHYKLVNINTVSKAVKRYGAFGPVYSDVMEVVLRAKDLIENRQATLAIFGRMANAAGPKLKGNLTTINKQGEWIDENTMLLFERQKLRFNDWLELRAQKEAIEIEKQSEKAQPEGIEEYEITTENWPEPELINFDSDVNIDSESAQPEYLDSDYDELGRLIV
jgi:hypothetical protein